MTKFLICHYKEASENLEVAEQYHEKLTNSVDPQALQCWLQEIEQAEQSRLVDPAMMDLYGVWVGRRTRPATDMAPDPLVGDEETRLPTELWLEMALMVEEKQ